MKRTIILYAGTLCLAVFILEWIEYKYITRVLTTEMYIVLLAIIFTALGVWAGKRLTGKQQDITFTHNEAAVKTIGLTRREQAVLELMAVGQSNKEIAKHLSVSPNTVKTHAANLFEKLEVNGRVEAINQARFLKIIP
ncbi:LuxR C-terminal-related transcriptional regulator [Kordiimonas aquimaris]|uniref:LuxR C-terminal-related transcriptional regulator n=1 Tax=Kordiimonas aquimaris TaxID=707591 RepID=UPI0021D36798|nr:LuxR C-terminal-related transcriptional regulator [Kordiimonas aquimaris]